MKNLIILPVLLLTLLVGNPAFSADFEKGLDAAQKGDFATALKEWKPLAEQGHARAQKNLGVMYERGEGVPQDYKTAVKWYRIAAEQGNSFGQNALGNMYDAGRGVPKDDKESAKWRTLAAEQGLASAQFNLGVMYATGRGVTQDDKTAVKWYRLAAKQGFAGAQTQVEELQKKIADQNELRELQARAKQGNADAQYKLGLMYQNGIGIPQNDKTAMKWYTLAAKQGNSDAQQRYGELVLQDIVYGSDVRALEDLGKYVETFCQRNFKCAFDKIWAYLDITGDGRLSLAEIARFQRNILKFGVLAQKEKVLSQKEKNDLTGNIVAINLASIIFLPITASSVLHSFDYNNDGLLSKGEVFGETEFAKLVGLDAVTLMGGVNFETLSKQLQEIRDLIPFPFPK